MLPNLYAFSLLFLKRNPKKKNIQQRQIKQRGLYHSFLERSSCPSLSSAVSLKMSRVRCVCCPMQSDGNKLLKLHLQDSRQECKKSACKCHLASSVSIEWLRTEETRVHLTWDSNADNPFLRSHIFLSTSPAMVHRNRSPNLSQSGLGDGASTPSAWSVGILADRDASGTSSVQSCLHTAHPF